MYNKFFFLLNDILPVLEKTYVLSGVFSKTLQVFYIVIRDLNIFSEKKTNLGLFYLKQNLNLHIFCQGSDLYSTRLLLRNLKLSLL